MGAFGRRATGPFYLSPPAPAPLLDCADRMGGAMRMGGWAWAAVLCLAPAPGAAGEAYEVDPVASEVLVRVGKSGLFSFAGHTHEVAAPRA